MEIKSLLPRLTRSQDTPRVHFELELVGVWPHTSIYVWQPERSSHLATNTMEADGIHIPQAIYPALIAMPLGSYSISYDIYTARTEEEPPFSWGAP